MYRSASHNITIDVTGRQTGKTTRLVDHLARHLNAHISNTAVLVTSTIRSSDMIKRHIRNVTYGQDSVTRVHYSVNPDPSMMRVDDHCMTYFDESDLINNLQTVPNSYYCTTPLPINSQTREIISRLDLTNNEVREPWYAPAGFDRGTIRDHSDLYWPDPVTVPTYVDEGEETRELTAKNHMDMYLERLGVK